jgi:rubredoxin
MTIDWGKPMPNERRGRPPKRINKDVQCPACEVTSVRTVERNGEPVNVLNCPACGAVYNRATGDVLAHITPAEDLK